MRGVEVDDNEIKRILRQSDDPAERREAWEASKTVGAEVADDVRELARLRNEAARALGYRDWFALSLSTDELDEGKLADDARRGRPGHGRAVRALEEPRSTRGSRHRFGMRGVGAPPVALRRSVLPGDAARRGRSTSTRSSRARTSSRSRGRTLRRSRARGRRRSSSAATSTRATGKCQHAFCIDIDRRGDVRVLANVVPNHDWADTMLHELGHGVYDLGYDDDLPWLLREHAPRRDRGLGAPLRRARGRAGVARAHPRRRCAAEVSASRAALRAARAAELLVFTRWVLVMNAFERALYADPDGDLDATWWELVARYQLRHAAGRPARTRLGREDPHRGRARLLPHVSLRRDRRPAAEAGARGVRRRHRRPARGRGPRCSEKLFSPGESVRWDHLVEHGLGLAALGRVARSRRRAAAERMSDVAPLVQEPTVEEEERKTSYLELFFDLVFVFAFTQVTALILEDTSLAGFARAALVLAMVWWAWSAYTWMTNAIDIENVVTRVIVFAAMAAGFFMALAVPDAFQDEAAWFAVAYFVVRDPQLDALQLGCRVTTRRSSARRSRSPLVRHRGARRARGRLRRRATTAPGSGSRRSTIDVVGTLTVARAGWKRLPVALRRALRAHRDHRARRVDRRDRDRRRRTSSAT